MLESHSKMCWDLLCLPLDHPPRQVHRIGFELCVPTHSLVLDKNQESAVRSKDTLREQDVLRHALYKRIERRSLATSFFAEVSPIP